MIIITGGTGRLGSQIVDRLLDRVSADGVGVSVRDTGRAADLAARGVRVRRGDFTDPGSLADAFEGATQVLIVSTDQAGEAAIAQHVAAIDAARDAGAEWTAAMIGHGVPADQANMLLGMFHATRRGEFSTTGARKSPPAPGHAGPFDIGGTHHLTVNPPPSRCGRPHRTHLGMSGYSGSLVDLRPRTIPGPAVKHQTRLDSQGIIRCHAAIFINSSVSSPGMERNGEWLLGRW
ncbi:NAD(P)H-binding protein [Streptosporangium subroseum]|uniref:NAD(P)H-binding protein n=1 Tax=Streptosporangium subroseum TaxID=106412 RepID=UPI00308DDD6F|nr:NAD(P)H-binding protein [Streptosporangium subroseum]